MYVDEMWLECMQGRAMQDVLAAKATKKRPPRRPPVSYTHLTLPTKA